VVQERSPEEVRFAGRSDRSQNPLPVASLAYYGLTWKAEAAATSLGWRLVPDCAGDVHPATGGDPLTFSAARNAASLSFYACEIVNVTVSALPSPAG
jgi:hypothetical protein